MAYLIHINEEGLFQEYELQKKITTIGPDRTDIRCTSSPNMFFHVFERGNKYEVKALTPHSFFIHQGKKKQNLLLSECDYFEIEKSKFIFSIKSVSSKKEDFPSLKHYQSFYELSQALSQACDAPLVLKKLLHLILELTHATKGFILSHETQSIIATKFISESEIEHSFNDLSRTLIQQVWKSRDVIILDNIANCDGGVSLHYLQVSSVACFPIMRQSQLVGYLYLGSNTAEGFFDPMTVELIKIVLAQASLILESRHTIDGLKKENKALSDKIQNNRIMGESFAFKQVMEKIKKIAPFDVSVLLLGETGTGKELMAREIHRQSRRAEKPFVAINCGSIPENLLESILFGHKKGAFTDAKRDHLGKFELADGGTVFLDEIAEMPLSLQVKLLRVLQEKKIEKLGDVKEVDVNFRLIAATHQNIEKMMEEARFRPDLYHRMNEVCIDIPPLRDRSSDILLLAEFFLEKYSSLLECSQKSLSQEVRRALLDYAWPGNVRELENIIKRGLILSQTNFIESYDLDMKNKMIDTAPLLPLKEARNKFHKEYVNKALSLYNGDKSMAASALGISVRTLFRSHDL